MPATTNTFAPEPKSLNSFYLPYLNAGSKVIVIGAGAFGGWTALSLLRKKFNVTLIDSWGPGNSRSSSGDETRVIRSTYGNNEVYFDMNVRALSLWREFEQQTNRTVFINKGVLWLCHDEKTSIVDDSIPFAQKHQMAYDYLTVDQLQHRFALIDTTGIHHAYFDPFGGYLKARESCRLVAEKMMAEGGTFLTAHCKPGPIKNNRLEFVELSDGTRLEADAFVFACGSWLGKIFPDALNNIITCSKQEVYYFGVPHDLVKEVEQLPVWIDVDGKDFYYGIPSNDGRGFKIGVDRRGAPFDPDNGERILDAEVLAHAREFLAHRFPTLRNAPLLESRVCPYENSPDGNFVIDQHPKAGNIIIAGGGSGHGFKHGPAVGELITESICGNKKVPGLFSFKRFNT